VIAVVILFVGFPQVYTTVSVCLHIPLVILLSGIIARGTSFTFRNYDAIKDDWQAFYSRIFAWSSFVTPFFLGVIAASAVSGRMDTGASSFYTAYMQDWLSGFSFSTGFFTTALCGFIAAVFLVGEVESADDKAYYIRIARAMNMAMIGAGGLVFITAGYEKVPLTTWVFGNAVGLIAVVCAILSLLLLWLNLYRSRILRTRILVGIMVSSLLIAVTYDHFPDIILLKNRAPISLLESGGGGTISMLGGALLIGSLFILPCLFYLLYRFDEKGGEARTS
jgi:cytochrome bd ubiquinol oxidase subunit II